MSEPSPLSPTELGAKALLEAIFRDRVKGEDEFHKTRVKDN